MTITIMQMSGVQTVLFQVSEVSVHKDKLGQYIVSGVQDQEEGVCVFLESSRTPPEIKE